MIDDQKVGRGVFTRAWFLEALKCLLLFSFF